ncbi:putative iron-sulfur cluster-binding protein [Aspergillus undulatus]|uniref:putative iron-sulfur cluster-binding protein n=1 Tax=Aspergillus undulatus TaxID=1810928 RepID=UPI003CCD862D
MLDPLSSALVALLVGLICLYLSQTKRPKVIPAPNLQKAETEPEPEPGPSATPPSVTKEPDFPPDWLTSPRIFELERRAIFSKTWIPLTLLSRLNPKPGTYITLTLSSIPLVLILDKDLTIRAFHNVCRHRAYPVTTRESGCSTVLACRYHGWSYNSRGRLIRAPQFEGISGFEKEMNGLFGVRVMVEGGVVWVNLGRAGIGMDRMDGEDEEIDLPGVSEPKPQMPGVELDFKGYTVWVGGGAVEGVFNWKVALQQTAITKALGLKKHHQPSLNSSSILRYIQCKLSLSPSPKEEPIYLFPNMFFVRIPRSGYLLSLSFLPISERTTSVRYDLYSSTPNSKNEIPESVENNIKGLILELETITTSTLPLPDSGFAGAYDPKPNTGPDLDLVLYPQTQTHILTLLKSHSKLERAQGVEIHLARREPRRNERYEIAERLCAELELGCVDTKGGCLSW